MLYERRLRKVGEILILDTTAYQITGVEGYGGSSVVYQAFYRDSLNQDQTHQVLIKELFPWNAKKVIYRDQGGAICCQPQGRELMETNRRRYREGNQANLELLKAHPAHISGNLNSYEAYGTYYTVLAFHGGENLEHYLKQKKHLSLGELTVLFLRILTALEYFHKNGLLHLDISPENILLLPEQALIIDYNSVWHLEDLEDGEFLFGQREGYSAPELQMQDRPSIGFASDTYSLCAVFYRMISGSSLTEQEIIGGNLGKQLSEGFPVFSGAPRSAVHKTVQILTKGLHMLSRRRYQSVEELRCEVEELQRRINGSGVSHSALWESSRFLCKKRGKRTGTYLQQELVVKPKTCYMDHMVLLEHLKAGTSFLLTGSGGMGKTRLLKEFWNQGAKDYKPDEPVICYIPLKDYQGRNGEKDYIRSFLLRHLRCGKKGSSMEDALYKLEQLLDLKSGLGVSLILLLDGLNEAGNKRGNLIKEIEELETRDGVSLMVTERSDEVLEYELSNFLRVELLPLSENTVITELENRKLPIPKEPRLSELLRIPMMLELYEQSCLLEVGEHKESVYVSTALTPEALVEQYLHQLLCYQLRIDSGNEGAQLCHRYILTYLLPAIALKMEENQSTLLIFEELYELVRESYQLLYEEVFGKSFRQFLGKSRKMLEHLENEAEWYDFTVEEQLIRELRLLVRTESGSYSLFHDNFIPCLADTGRENRKILEAAIPVSKEEERQGNPSGRKKKGIFISTVIFVLAAVIWSGSQSTKTSSMMVPQELSEEEKQQFYQAAERMLMTAYAWEKGIQVWDEILAETKKLITVEKYDNTEKSEKDTYDRFLKDCLEKLGETSREDELIYVELLTARIPEVEQEGVKTALEHFFQGTSENRKLLENIIGWFGDWVTDPGYSSQQKVQFLAESEEFFTAYQTRFFYEFSLAADLLDEDSRNYLLGAEALQYVPQFDAWYLEQMKYEQLTLQEQIRRLESHLISGENSLEKKETRLSNRMLSMGFSLRADQRSRIVEDFFGRLRQMDEASQLYDQVLMQCKEYLEGRISASETIELLTGYQTSLMALEKAAVPHPVDADFFSVLREEMIDPEDYIAIADEYMGNLTGYIQDTERLLAYLDGIIQKAEGKDSIAWKALKVEQETLLGMQKGFQGYYFCAINYLFANWDDQNTVYIQEKLMPSLQSLIQKDLVWEKDQQVLQQRASDFLDDCQMWKNQREQGLMSLGYEEGER